MIKRISLFLIVNILILVTLSISTSLLGVNQYLTQNGLNLGQLLVFALIFGFAGSFISLFLSKPIAKWTMGVKLIDPQSGNYEERWLYQMVDKHAQRLNIKTPEVGVYQGEEMNAFATGASKNSSLIAFSTGILNKMKKEEVEAVACHELGHVANGDMVTMTLIQGVINTFVIFISRIIGYVVDRVILKNDSEESGFGYTITVIALDIVLGILASIVVATFSRYREYRADAASAKMMGDANHMINALSRLAGKEAGMLPQNMQALGINNKNSWWALFSTHPSIEKRIIALQEKKYF